jgi:hypothetical protein
LLSLLHITLIAALTSKNLPPAQHHRQGVANPNPFPIELSGKVDMGAGGITPFAGGVTDWIISVNLKANKGSILLGDVHVDQNPPGAFIAIAVQVDGNDIPL